MLGTLGSERVKSKSTYHLLELISSAGQFVSHMPMPVRPELKRRRSSTHGRQSEVFPFDPF